MIFSQNTDTKNIKCFTDGQLNEIFKGVKQGEYLKVLQAKTEKALDNANQLVLEQKSTISKYKELNSGKDEIIQNNQVIYEQSLIKKDAQIERLDADNQILNKEMKKSNRKKFWNGLAYGGITGVLVTAATLILIQR